MPKYPVPLAVRLVVDAPPFMEKSPAVIVEEALERNPLPKVARSDWENAPATESVPKVAVWEYRLVELAVVLKRLVEVAFPAVRLVAVTELPEKELPEIVAPEIFVPLNWSTLFVWAMTW